MRRNHRSAWERRPADDEIAGFVPSPVTSSAAAAGRPATGYDVAARAGVSQSTVSRYLRGRGAASDERWLRVLRAAHELGYRPNALARDLSRRTSSMLGLVMTGATSSFYPALVQAVTRAAAVRPTPIMVLPVLPGEPTAAVERRLLESRVDSVLVATPLPAGVFARWANHGVRVVMLNEHGAPPEVPVVGCDQRGSMRRLVQRLYAAGHRRFHVIAGPPHSRVGEDRAAGVADALSGVRDTVVRTTRGDYGYVSGVRIGRALLDGPMPDAVVGCNDAMALGCLDALRDAGVSVPDRVSVVGFDDFAPGAWRAYRLTTVRQPLDLMAAVALHRLDAAERYQRGVAALMPGNIVERGSARLAGEPDEEE